MPSRGMIRSGIFGQDGPSTYYDPIERLKQLQQEFSQYPGAAPGGSGPTGLMSGDARGYSDMLNRQREFMHLDDFVQGGDGINERFNAAPSTTRSLSAATGGYNRDAFDVPSAGIGGAEMDQFRAAAGDDPTYRSALSGLRRSGRWGLG